MKEFNFVIDKNANVTSIVMFGKVVKFENPLKIDQIEAFSSAIELVSSTGLTITEVIREENFTNFVEDLTELQKQFLIKLVENKSVSQSQFNQLKDSKGLAGVMRGFIAKIKKHYLPQFYNKYPGKGETSFYIYSLRPEYRNRIRSILEDMGLDVRENL